MTSPTPSAALFELLETQSIPIVIFDPRVLVGAMVASHATGPDERFVNAARLYLATRERCFLHCNSVPLMDMFTKLAQNPEKLRRAPAAEPLPHHGFMAREEQKVTKLMHWLFPVSGVLMLLSPFAFSLLYNKSYVDSALIFNIYLLILTSRVLRPQSFCLAYHHTSIVVWSGILEIIANVILSYWWMNLWGIFGLAMATVVAYFIQKIILVAYVQSKFGIKLQQYIHLKFYLLYSSALIIIFIITLNYLR